MWGLVDSNSEDLLHRSQQSYPLSYFDTWKTNTPEICDIIVKVSHVGFSLVSQLREKPKSSSEAPCSPLQEYVNYIKIEAILGKLWPFTIHYTIFVFTRPKCSIYYLLSIILKEVYRHTPTLFHILSLGFASDNI